MKMEQTECSETLAYKIQTLGFAQKNAYNTRFVLNKSMKCFLSDVFKGFSKLYSGFI